MSLDDARTNFYSYKQKKSETQHEYLRHFSSLIDVLEHYGAKVGSDDVFIHNVDKLVEEEAPGETAPLDIMKAYRVKLVAAARNRAMRESCKACNTVDPLAFLTYWPSLLGCLLNKIKLNS